MCIDIVMIDDVNVTKCDDHMFGSCGMTKMFEMRWTVVGTKIWSYLMRIHFLTNGRDNIFYTDNTNG